jgi:GT2 family glycosyltransferase
MGHKYLIFVDSDIILTSDSLRRLLDIYEKREDRDSIFAISFPYVTPINRLDLIWKIRIKYEYPYLLINKGILSLETVGVSATLINLTLVPKVGFFDEDIPLIEDLDYIRRATKLGYKALCDTNNPLLHDKYVRTLPFLKQILFKQGKPEAKLLLKHGLLKKAIRGLIYWNLLLFSIPFIIISPIPFLFLFIIGYTTYAFRLRGWGKIIGFPIIAIYRMALNLSIFYGLIFFIVKQGMLRRMLA